MKGVRQDYLLKFGTSGEDPRLKLGHAFWDAHLDQVLAALKSIAFYHGDTIFYDQRLKGSALAEGITLNNPDTSSPSGSSMSRRFSQ